MTKRAMKLTVKELAERLGCPYEGDGGTVTHRRRRPGQGRRRPGRPRLHGRAEIPAPLLEATAAAAVILPPGRSASTGIPVLRCAESAARLRPGDRRSSRPPVKPAPGVHPTAVVAPTARLGRGRFDRRADCVVGDGAEIGDGTVVYPSRLRSIPGSGSARAASSIPHVSLREGRAARRPGHPPQRRRDRRRRLRLPQGRRRPAHQDPPDRDGRHRGRRRDRGEFDRGPGRARRDGRSAGGPRSTTWSRSPTTSRSGKTCSSWPKSASRGAPRSGRNSILSGQVGVPDHIEIGENVVIAAKTGVTNHIPSGSFVSGSPHLDVRVWRKFWACAPQLYDLIKDVKKLRARVEELEKNG